MNGETVRCPRCGRQRSPGQFVSAAGRPTQSCSVCLERGRLANRQRRDNMGADGVRADNLRQKYGITPEEYDTLRAEQGHRCAICGVHERDITIRPVGRPRADGRPAAEAFRLVVDHCHRTGRVRGLLCGACNSLIGHAGDSPEVLHAAADYLRRDQAPGAKPRLARLRVLDSQGRTVRTMQFRGGATVRVDGYEVHVPEGATRTVVCDSGLIEPLTT